MMTKLLVLAVAVAMSLETTWAAPQPPTRVDIDKALNEFFAGLSDMIMPDQPFVIAVNEPHVAEMFIQMNDVSITGVNHFTSQGSAVEGLLEGTVNITLNIKSPKVAVSTDSYFINGTMADTIELVGEGPGMLSVDDMAVMVKGSGSFNGVDLSSIMFTEAVIDLEMWRWTVNLENLMPGTDLGTVFNEFFTMCGPEIFDTIEKNWNNSGKVVTILNNLVSSVTGGGSQWV